MRGTLLLLLLLCSCTTQRQAEEFFDAHPEKLAKYVDADTPYTQQYGGAYAAKHFPPKFYLPAVFVPPALSPARSIPDPLLVRWQVNNAAQRSYVQRMPGSVSIKPVYVQDTVLVGKLQTALHRERQAKQLIKRQLQRTQAQRDYWRELNRKKFWALVAMAVFAFLYILFRILAARLREPRS